MEILDFKRVWLNCIQSFEERKHMDFKIIHISVSNTDKQLLLDLVRKYPYIPEPAIALAFVLKHGETSEVTSPLIRFSLHEHHHANFIAG